MIALSLQLYQQLFKKDCDPVLDILIWHTWKLVFHIIYHLTLSISIFFIVQSFTVVLTHLCVCTLSPSGTLQLRYNLGGLNEPFTIDLDQRNLANGQPHNVNLTRTERDIHIQVRVENIGVNINIFIILVFVMRKPSGPVSSYGKFNSIILCPCWKVSPSL